MIDNGYNEWNMNIARKVVVAILLLLACVLGGLLFKDFLYNMLNPPFDDSEIFQGEGVCPADTLFSVNGNDARMMVVK